MLSQSLKQYGVDRWGAEFLKVGEDGHLRFCAPKVEELDMHELVCALEKRGIRTPFTLRFPTMIEGQMERLLAAFRLAAKQHGFEGGHIGVFPVKVNQRRGVVETIVQARERLGYGLEAGSKPELLLTMVQPVLEGGPLLCNGYKDLEFMRMAFHAAELGHEVIVVLESVSEVRRFLAVKESEEWNAMPKLGMRAKLYSRGSGRWQSSGGDRSKFGLNTGELLKVLQILEEAGLADLFELLHFHIGSQITQIKRIKVAVREGGRIWGELRRRCESLRYLDLGGGIGVDYDGSHTSHSASANYSMEEYASQVVFELTEVMREMEVPQPTLITESGRILVASHAVTITDLREVQGELYEIPEAGEDENRLIEELRHTLAHISVKNIEEYFHDALDYRDEALQLFSRGYLSLEERAAAEGLFQRIRVRCESLVKQLSRPPEEILDHLRAPYHKYLANFSIFQSLPDTWSIEQVFPAAPLSRHGEPATVNAEVVDITCDSDGCVDVFAHPEENLSHLPLHALDEGSDPYYLAFFLTGAYQDSLANIHNMFSRCNEVIVRRPGDEFLVSGSEWIDISDTCAVEVIGGTTNDRILTDMDYDLQALIASVRDRHLDTETTMGQPWVLGLLQGYPYLQPD